MTRFLIFRGLFLIQATFLFILTAGAAAGNDSAAYATGIEMIGKSQSEADYTRAAAYFEKISGQELPWLSRYYAAFCYIQASYKATTDKQKDVLLDKAQPLIDKALQFNPNEPEIFVLQAFLYQSRIQVNPPVRGMSYSSKADATLKKAIAADDSNPRAWSLMAYNVYYTPAAFGGGSQKALPVFQKAKEKFQFFRPVRPFLPNWGEQENLQMIKTCKLPSK